MTPVLSALAGLLLLVAAAFQVDAVLGQAVLGVVLLLVGLVVDYEDEQ